MYSLKQAYFQDLIAPAEKPLEAQLIENLGGSQNVLQQAFNSWPLRGIANNHDL